MIRTRKRIRMLIGAALALVALAPPLAAQPRPVEGVSVRAELAVDDLRRRVERDDWILRHDGPWLYTNDEWTNAAGVTAFPAGSAYWLAVIVDECAGCTFEVRFFDEDAGGYFPLTSILTVESDGSLVTATGRFQSDRDMRGELYVQMAGADLYKTYIALAQIR